MLASDALGLFKQINEFSTCAHNQSRYPSNQSLQKSKFHKNLQMFHQKLLNTCVFVPLLAFCRQTNKRKRQLLHRMGSLQMFDVSFTLLAKYEISDVLLILWHFCDVFN